MVIFNSYVSLPEGTATKPIQGLFNNLVRLAMGDQLKPIEGLIFQYFFSFFSIFSWFASKAVLIPYARPQRGPRGRLGGLLKVHWDCLFGCLWCRITIGIWFWLEFPEERGVHVVMCLQGFSLIAKGLASINNDVYYFMYIYMIWYDICINSELVIGHLITMCNSHPIVIFI